MRISIFLIAIILCCSFVSKNLFDDQTSVSEVLIMLGEKAPDNKPNTIIDGVSAQVGEDIVKLGSSKRKGLKNAKRQSKHFVCTSCHNIEREDPDLANPNPQDRLLYTAERGLPFLQATSLYGIVNRTSYYNDDYLLKYGDLVTPARNDIREAIQLCATECSQGRALTEWEMESVLAYLWTIDLKMSDLKFSDEEKSTLEEAINNGEKKDELIQLVKSKYAQKSAAHFVDAPADREVGTGLEGIPANGELIYENSCMHCHYKKRYSFLNLDKSKISFKYLDNKASSYSRYSIYQVTRYGTDPKHWKKAYMPHYPIEKMSEQQLADLRAFIRQEAN